MIYVSTIASLTVHSSRVLLATIHNLGKCPCPCCEMPRESIPELGTRNDAARRRNLRRQDGHALSHKVKIARKAIYESGKGVKSAAVENLLSFGSYVPTEVRQIILSSYDETDDLPRMPLAPSSVFLLPTYSCSLLLISYMRSS